MVNIKVGRNMGYKQVTFSVLHATLRTGLLDKEEATQMAIDLISAAEDVLPIGTDAEKDLFVIREALLKAG